MKRITLTIDIGPGANTAEWELADWRGLISSGHSTDTVENLVALWAGDISHVLNNERANRYSHQGARGVDLAATGVFDWAKESW